jgi:hypothetical protein
MRWSAGPLPSGVLRGYGEWRGAQLLGRRPLYRCRFRSTSFYPPATSPSVLSRVKILRHFSGGGDSSVLGEEVSSGTGRGRCRIGLSRSCASPMKVATSSVLASAFFT